MSQKTKIVIIDDDPDIVEALTLTLENKGYSVLSAESGEKGLKLTRTEMPELVILDVMLETKDKGFEISRKLKNDPKTKDIPILMLTALKEKTGFDFSREAGDQEWLPVDFFSEKPIKPADLLKRVRQLTGK